MKLFGLAILIFGSITGCAEKSSIGVIGGADGPTAIILSSGFDWWDLVIIPACCALTILLVWKIKGKR